MDNHDLAQIFNRIADLLEIKGELIFKTRAYRNAALSLEELSEDIFEIYKQGRLQEIPGVGDAIAKKITELLETGKLGFLEKLEQEVPPSLLEILHLPELGPKRVNILWKEAGITTLDELEKAARSGRLRGLSGIGEKLESRILASIHEKHG
jgi:DNA polymerase (family 10)